MEVLHGTHVACAVPPESQGVAALRAIPMPSPFRALTSAPVPVVRTPLHLILALRSILCKHKLKGVTTIASL